MVDLALAGPGPAAQVRVLYVDDDPGTCRLVRRHLEREGFAVEVASDGDIGLALARERSFDVVALDHYMPGRDGLDVLADLNALPEAPPVIFVTAAEEPRIAVTALKAGAFDYVVKDVQGTFLEFIGDFHPPIAGAVAQLLREKVAAEQELAAKVATGWRPWPRSQALLLREVNHRVANSLQLIGVADRDAGPPGVRPGRPGDAQAARRTGSRR